MAQRLLVLLGFILLLGSSIHPWSIYNGGEEVDARNAPLLQRHERQQSDPIRSATEDAMQWMHTYGSAEGDAAWSIIQTTDGSYAFTGSTGDWPNETAWLVKIDAFGNEQWTQIYNFTSASAIIQSVDGGYALAGTWSKYYGHGDAFLVKTDSQGMVQWTQLFQWKDNDSAETVIQTSDGGFLLGGFSSDNVGSWDSWLMKTDVDGHLEWTQFYDLVSHNHIQSVIQTTEGGFAFTGDIWSSEEGLNDAWLVKINATGTMEWNRTYGGSVYDRAYEVYQMADGGFALVGATSSFGAGEFDAWLLKTDIKGNLQWHRTYGREARESAYAGSLTADGGIVLAGTTKSYEKYRKDMDLWLVKLDTSGVVEWNQTYGGRWDDLANSVTQTTDGGFIIAGNTHSYEAHGVDAWVVKTDAGGITPDIEVQLLNWYELIFVMGLFLVAIVVVVLWVKVFKKSQPKWR